MFSRRTQRFITAIAFAAIAPSCSRNEKPSVERLAILRFENLTGDEALNWMGAAASEVMVAELAGSRTLSVISSDTLRGVNRALGARPASAPGISTERTAALAAGATAMLYGSVSRIGGKLRLDAAVYDLAREKIEHSLTARETSPASIISLAGSLAGQLDHPLRAFETQNVQALERYCDGRESQDPSAALQDFSNAARSDPNFGLAYVAWVQAATQQNNRAEAERVLALAKARGNAIADVERARLEAIAAELREDSGAALQALATVGRLNPMDLTLFRQLAAANLNVRRYGDAIENFKKALAIERDDPAMLNQLGYAQMYAGNLAEARGAIEKYLRLRPSDPNASDSLGDVNFGLGQFKEAERYYRQAYRKDPNFNGGMELFKAARAHLMTGDIAGADAVFGGYIARRQKEKDLAIPLRQAEWQFLSGRRKPAISQLESFAKTAPATTPAGLISQCYAQLAIWSLEMGENQRARDFAMKAAGGKSVTATAVVARLLAEPPTSVSEWTARIDRALPGAAQERARNLVLAYAFLFAKQFQAAVPLLKQAYERSSPEPAETLPVLLAWALVETGKVEDAAPLVARNPIPGAEAEDLLTSLSLPRLFYLRGEIQAKQGHTQQAQSNYNLFLTLSGPDVDRFGDEDRAREALAK